MSTHNLLSGYHYIFTLRKTQMLTGAFLLALHFVVNAQTIAEPNYILVAKDALPSNGESVTGTFFFFDSSTGALRGGSLSSSRNWAPDSLGQSSFAHGINVKATGNDGASALGFYATASGSEGAIAMGDGAHASGDFGATALGYISEAAGIFGATALGSETIASGSNGATAAGYRSIASGSSGATALGSFTEASGIAATALGYNTEASGDFGATTLGYFTEVSGDLGATTLGYFTRATGNNCTVIGRYNDTIVAAGTEVTSSSPLFIVGNGDGGAGNQSNALVLRKDGNIGIGNNASKGQLSIKQRGGGDNEGLRLISNANNESWEIRYTSAGGNLRFRAFDDNDMLEHTVEIRRSDGAYLQNSDKRLKKNITILDQNHMQNILAIQPITYHWKKDGGEGEKSIGVVAQDLEKLFPQAVHTNEDGYKMVNYDVLSVLSIQAVKEQQGEITELRNLVTQLQSTVQSLLKNN